MTKSWEQIEKHYTDISSDNPAVQNMLNLVMQIRESDFVDGIHAWTSMFDLNITQTKVTYPCNEQYLHIAPTDHDMIEFRFVDTPIKEKQWIRKVPAEEAFDRLKRFFIELNWFG